jgi:hypothetical protein
MMVLQFESCRLNRETKSIPISKPSMITLLDSVQASKAVIADDIDGLYDQISQVEIEIQMKRTTPFKNRNEALLAYKKFIATEVSSWKESEREAMVGIFEKVKALCDTISPRIFPGGMRLIKVKTNHFGENVYYTNGRNIFIPENIFPIENEEREISVMVHEVFHILSRYEPALRHQLYRLIGFEKANKPIKLNQPLQEKLLTNPDGVSYQYFIALDSVKAVPLITSRYGTYRETSPHFFDYLNFDLYQLKDKGTHYEAQSDESGKTLLELQKTPMFFKKIKDNTQYIIHPDEIMADNFMLALQANQKNDFSKFSKDGRVLIEQILDILGKF